MGMGFVRTAREETETLHRAVLLGYANLAHETTLRLARYAELDQPGRERLQRELAELAAAIDAAQ